MEYRDVRHLTLTTGHLSVIPRFAVADAEVEKVRRIVEAGHGWLPAVDMRVDFFRPHTDPDQPAGACFFQLGRSGREISRMPYTLNWCAWLEDMSQPTWDMACAQWEMMPPVFRNLPEMPVRPAVPWLATFTTPWIMEMERANIAELGGLEAALFFAAEDHDRKKIR
jgi:hypothetical protein